MTDDVKYEDKRETITEILNTQQLPTVVRICDDGKCADPSRDVYLSRISGNTQVLLQARIKVKYGRIKVLNYYDNNAMEQENGCEYVLEHDTYVGEEYLMPLKYRRKIKFTHRPGSWRRYATIAQVLSELPRYIRTGEDTVAVPSSGIGKNVIVPANTTLEVVRKFIEPHANITFLECRDGNTSYVFGEKDRINCTEVEDSKLYNLFELVRCKMLPKVLMFQDVETEDAILMDHHLNSIMLTVVEGPVELLECVDIDVLVGWVRDKEHKTYKTVLIPRGLWNMMTVQRRTLRGEEEKDDYIKRKYGHCNDIHFIENSLYLMSLDQCDVTWLRNPAFYMLDVDGLSMYKPVPISFHDSSSSDGDDDDDGVAVGNYYEEIKAPVPPVPERHPISRSDLQQQTVVLPTVKEKIQEKKSLFHRVHSELKGLFIRKNIEQKAPEIPRRPFASERRASKQQNETNSDQKNTKIGTQVSDTQAGTATDTIPIEHPCADDDGPEYDYPDCSAFSRNVSQKRPLPNLPDNTTNMKSRELESHRSVGKHEPQPPMQNPPPSPVRKSPLTPGIQASTYPAVPSSPATVNNQGPNYVSLSMEGVEHLFWEGLTKDDFFRYTVIETAYCFKHCGLDKFADICRKNILDGSFFNGFDLDELKKDPFNLTNFSVLKVRKMINDGWRPKVCK